MASRSSPTYQMGTKYSHGISELGQFTTWFGVGVHLNEINSRSLRINVNQGDSQTPLTLDLQFETDGPTEITGSISMDVIKFEVSIRFTLRYHQPTGAVDLTGWVDDINAVTYTPRLGGGFTVSGTFLGQPLNDFTTSPAQYRTDLIGKVVDVTFTTSSVLDPGGTVQKAIREGIFSHLSDG